ncbi:MAG: hypothetical protein IPJ65_33145 [Archangiaceae bacterium]|nr:hypothetical protein [Archangiaceae bacterium]
MNDTTLKLCALLAMMGTPVLAQSTVEKAKSTGNDAKREVKKGAHRVGEELCMGTKAECASKKVKHRVEEGKDAVVDQAKETKDKVDSNGT